EPAPEQEAAAEPVQKSDLFAKVLAKPPVRKLAKDHGLDLTTITPTGQHGEVTRADVHAVLEADTAETTATSTAPVAGESESIKVTGVRKATAKAVTESYTSAPHNSVFRQVDATRTMEYLETLKKHPRFETVRVYPLLVLTMAVSQSALNTPQANDTRHGYTYSLPYYINLRLAAT